MKTNIKQRLARWAALGLLGVGVAAPLQVLAQDETPPPPHEHPRGGPHGHFGGPFMHELRDLNLSDAQKQTIHGYLEAARQNGRAEFESLRGLRHAFETAAPGSAGYSTAVTQLADAEAKAAGDRVQKMAALRAQIYAVLTDAQKSTLAAKLASLPEPPAPPV